MLYEPVPRRAVYATRTYGGCDRAGVPGSRLVRRTSESLAHWPSTRLAVVIFGCLLKIQSLNYVFPYQLLM
jgi:hypothetical protein